jgi:hypothetical protein
VNLFHSSRIFTIYSRTNTKRPRLTLTLRTSLVWGAHKCLPIEWFDKPWQSLLGNEASCVSADERIPYRTGRMRVGDWRGGFWGQAYLQWADAAAVNSNAWSCGQWVDGMQRSRVSWVYLFTKRSTVSPNIFDNKQGFANNLWKKLLIISDNKRLSVLKTAELLPNIRDNHQVGSQR